MDRVLVTTRAGAKQLYIGATLYNLTCNWLGIVSVWGDTQRLAMFWLPQAVSIGNATVEEQEQMREHRDKQFAKGIGVKL